MPVSLYSSITQGENIKRTMQNYLYWSKLCPQLHCFELEIVAMELLHISFAKMYFEWNFLLFPYIPSALCHAQLINWKHRIPTWIPQSQTGHDTVTLAHLNHWETSKQARYCKQWHEKPWGSFHSSSIWGCGALCFHARECLDFRKTYAKKQLTKLVLRLQHFKPF